MKIQDAYTRWSATYDSDRNGTRDLDRQVTESTLADRKYQNILELGCGTGKNTALLDRIGRRILALDFSRNVATSEDETNNRPCVFCPRRSDETVAG
jgi:malonyl-CoA O-methyltransferase